MKDYSAMSDHLINQQVAESIAGRYLYFQDYVWDSEEEKRFNPCNYPADAWPIILENKINIDHRSGFKNPMAKSCTDNSLYATHHNVLRAAMTVYLMMKDAEKGHG